MRRTTGSLSSWPICAPRFGGPPTTATSMSPPPSPPMRRSSAFRSTIYEPIAWAEELIEPARAVDHPRLAFLYVMASQCFMDRTDRGGCRLQRGRPDRSSAVSRDTAAVRRRRLAWHVVPGHRPARTVGRVVPRPARTRPRHPRRIIRACLVFALTVAGSGEEAMDRRERPHRGRRGNRQPVCARVRASRLRCRLP